MKVGYERKAPGYPLTMQREALLAAGVDPKKIWTEGRTEGRDDLIGQLRRRDILVVHSFHLLGRSRKDLQSTLDECAQKGIRVRDCLDPPLEASAALAERMTDALRKSTGERVRPTKAQAAEGGRKRKGKVKARDKSRAELHEIWFSKSYLTNDDAAEEAGVPKRSLYRLFGASGRPAGWPGKRKVTEE